MNGCLGGCKAALRSTFPWFRTGVRARVLEGLGRPS
ncbi:MAG: hypothetical protein JWO59_2901, partial [Chloroflexi bacterium]|nr:hypothetical protein [Chloroflexota bacterium]